MDISDRYIRVSAFIEFGRKAGLTRTSGGGHGCIMAQIARRGGVI